MKRAIRNTIGALGVAVFAAFQVKDTVLDYLYEQRVKEDSAAVTKAMVGMLRQPVETLDRVACDIEDSDPACKQARDSALKNLGASRFRGRFTAKDHQNSVDLAFRACAKRFGAPDCQIVPGLPSVMVMKAPEVIFPAGSKDYSQAQFVWKLPAYSWPAVMAGDGRIYDLDQSRRTQPASALQPQ